jgi:hydroxymethylpyrimidine/phosphomethylpyrimidine kinase
MAANKLPKARPWKNFARRAVSRYIPVMPQTPPVVLSIAGFDPSSGAGVTADIKTIAAHGCYGVAAITALTVQSTAGVRRWSPVNPRLVQDSLEELIADVKISAVHIGMLGSRAVATRVARCLEIAKLPCIVLDPVLKASSGASLLDEKGTAILTQKLLPLATVVTPNVDEAAALTGVDISSLDDMKQAAGRLHELGANGVVITGGHMQKAVDLLSVKDESVQIFTADKLDSACTHGTGCAITTPLACHLALGRSLSESVLLAKAYVTAAIASGYPLGKGTSPVNHMYRLKSHPRVGVVVKNFASGKD